IGTLIQMKDKGFSEYESLSSKNVQLLEMNNQLVHSIQETYKANRVPNGAGGANGLGIYQPGAKPDTPGTTDVRNLNLVNTDSSMPNLLQETEAEPATVLTSPQVVNIRKGQPKKFNWRKGGEKMAKNVTKGLKGAFAAERVPERKDIGMPYGDIGMPYNQTQQAIGGSDQGGVNRQQMGDGRGGAGFGWLGQKNAGTKQAGLTSMKNTSSANLSNPTAAPPSTLFGSELEARCDFEKRMIPSIVTRCVEEVEARGMDMEGIYRKSGGSGQVKLVQQGFEKDGAHFDISDPDLDIHAVTSALKQYFRKLPTPLITYDVYETFLEAGSTTPDNNNKTKQADDLRAAVSALPDHHRDVLEFLVQHLARVMKFEAENLMTPLNLSVVFAPTIMRPLSIEREMSDMQAQRTALQALLDLQEVIFGGGGGVGGSE
ncbi:RhoGAP-domain-containing protein, partial [Hortaea werneckii]